MRSFIILASLACAVNGATWTHDDPENWGLLNEDCNGKRQSPIDIQPDDVVYHPDLASIKYTGYDTKINCSLVNNGHVFQCSLGPNWLSPGIAHVSGGGFPDPTGEYAFLQFHFHWGLDDNAGAEHLIAGHGAAACFHMVHINNKYSGVAEAAGNLDGLAALGVLIEEGEHNVALEEVINHVEDVMYAGETLEMTTPLLLDDLFPKDRSRFFRYNGSLTTPMCMETVTWTVFHEPLTMSSAQLAKLRSPFREAKDVVPNKKIGLNYRPPQPLNGRTVYYSVQPTDNNEALEAGYFSYADDKFGPKNWMDIATPYGNFCDGKKNSPINIVKKDTTKVTSEKFGGPIEFNGYDEPMDLSLTNDGKSAVVSMGGETAYLSDGGLGKKMELFNIHFHWGETDDEGSEHSVDGKFYPLEVNFMHWNADKYDSADDTLDQDNTDGMANLAFMFELSVDDNEEWKPIFDAVEKAQWANQDPIPIAGVSLDSLLGKTHSYFRYDGSLTTPGCHEVVTWMVYDTPLQISTKQLAHFRRMYSSGTGSSSDAPRNIGNNFRPVQALNGRDVHHVVDPEDVSPVGSAAQLSVSLVLVAAVALFTGKLFC